MLYIVIATKAGTSALCSELRDDLKLVLSLPRHGVDRLVVYVCANQMFNTGFHSQQEAD